MWQTENGDKGCFHVYVSVCVLPYFQDKKQQQYWVVQIFLYNQHEQNYINYNFFKHSKLSNINWLKVKEENWKQQVWTYQRPRFYRRFCNGYCKNPPQPSTGSLPSFKVLIKCDFIHGVSTEPQHEMPPPASTILSALFSSYCKCYYEAHSIFSCWCLSLSFKRRGNRETGSLEALNILC